jgi:hypothetical protein
MLFTLVRHGECLGQTDPQFWADPDSALSPQWFELANGSITRVRLIPDPQAERLDWPLYPPIPVEIKNINDIAHLACLEPSDRI